MDFGQIKVLLGVTCFLALLIYLLFHNVAFKNVFKTLKQTQQQQHGFYECGYRTRTAIAGRYNINMYIICTIAILYNIECIFLIIFFSSVATLCLLDLILICIYLLFFVIGISFELRLKNTDWDLQ
uniref:NADH-ubiquinone oxidoreductase chain 3 n=1 Tax=Nyctotherus ovalis TaxID=70075 RepID=F1AAJ0_NYCOV|nr:NADH-ubiquinone oxidoreductase subunit 3 [Nyctotherus ovalis]